MRGILEHKSNRSLAPAHGRADNRPCNLSTWFSKGWRHRTMTSPNHCPTICCQDDYFYCLLSIQTSPSRFGGGLTLPGVLEPVAVSNTSFTSTEPSVKRPFFRYGAALPGDA